MPVPSSVDVLMPSSDLYLDSPGTKLKRLAPVSSSKPKCLAYPQIVLIRQEQIKSVKNKSKFGNLSY
ncbi:hypothetical protein V7S43_005376 [Phytophthora oleae]|uniref:Uncharacterized protein n=1 Tax=Phytophthora oleae TaxID=2107226 RepID=A0ABD3FST3_9STRA